MLMLTRPASFLLKQGAALLNHLEEVGPVVRIFLTKAADGYPEVLLIAS